MVNWDDPALERSIAHVVLWGVTFTSGLYMWELVVSFGFDWQCITRKRPFRWTQIPYFGARYGPVWALLNAAVATNVLSPTSSAHCTTMWRLIYIGAHISVISASLLLIVRVVAISQHSRVAIVALASLWLAEVGTAFLNLALVKGHYSPELFACAVGNTVMTRPTILIAFAIHFACLVLAISLLLRSRGARLWRLLLSQGLVYFAVTLFAYIPTATLLLLTLNDSMNLCTQVQTMIAVVICSCRMYRGLVNYDRAGTQDAFMLTETRLDWGSDRPATAPRIAGRTYKIDAGVQSVEAIDTKDDGHGRFNDNSQA